MALIYPCLHRGVQEINRHSWQIIWWLAEMIAAVPHQRDLPGLGTVSGTPRGLQERRGDARKALGQAGSPNLERRLLGYFWGSDGIGAGSRRAHPSVCRKAGFRPFLAKSRLCHRFLAVSLIFPPNGNNLQD